MNFTNMTSGDYTTYPKKQGEYLIKYYFNDLPYYMIAYFWPEGNEKFGFYYDENCEKEANIETQWNYKPFAYYYLPNMLLGEDN